VGSPTTIPIHNRSPAGLNPKAGSGSAFRAQGGNGGRVVEVVLVCREVIFPSAQLLRWTPKTGQLGSPEAVSTLNTKLRKAVDAVCRLAASTIIAQGNVSGHTVAPELTATLKRFRRGGG